MDISPSGQFSNRYQILEQLGQGGMAIVYKALDTRLEREVAIKVIRRDVFPPDELERIQKRFEREAKSLARLSHPNIVKVLDYDKQDDTPYIVMEYVQGKTLKEIIAARGDLPMSWQEAAQLLIPVADALQHAHQHHIIHRDIKPSNIIITETGEPMLTDFGIVKILGTEGATHMTTTGRMIGTPDYMAPEQVTEGDIDQRADVYSLGVILYELLTSHKPYEGDTPMTVLLKRVSEPLPSPKRFVPDLPDAVERIILRALARQPEERYQNMAELGAVLASGGERESVLLTTIQATPDISEQETSGFPSDSAQTAKRIEARSQRRMRSPIFIGILALLLLGGAAAVFWRPIMAAILPATPTATATLIPTFTLTVTASATLSPTPTYTPASSPTLTPTSPPTDTPTPNTPMLYIDHNSFCRTGPGASYPTVTDFASGITLPILATNNEGWWLVQINLSWTKHKQCWIYGNTPIGNWTGVEIITPAP